MVFKLGIVFKVAIVSKIAAILISLKIDSASIFGAYFRIWHMLIMLLFNPLSKLIQNLSELEIINILDPFIIGQVDLHLENSNSQI